MTRGIAINGKLCHAQDPKAGANTGGTITVHDKSDVTHLEAIDRDQLSANTHDGTAIYMSENPLLVMANDGKEHVLSADDAVIVVCDGKICRVGDLEQGVRLRVTASNLRDDVLVDIEAIRSDADPS